jgi:NitT/TauT family transport system substrate-binding protein
MSVQGSFIRAAALLGACLLAGAAHGAGDHIVLLVGGIEKQIYLPVPLAEQLGYFREQDLDLELQSEPSGVNAEDQLLVGTAQGVVGFYDHTIDLQAKGKSVEAVVLLDQTPGEALMISRKIAATVHSVADLKGRSVGVAGLGSSTEVLTRYLAAKAGLRVADLATVPVGAGGTLIGAMRQGRIDAAMTTDPTISQLAKQGTADILVDLRSPEETQRILGGDYPAACIYMQTAWVGAHRDAVRRLVLALLKSLRYIQTHSAEDIASHLPPEYLSGDRELYVRALAANKGIFSPDGRMPANGPATSLRVLSVVDRAVQGKQIDLSRTYTTEFLPTMPP